MDPATAAAVAAGVELAQTPGMPPWVMPLVVVLLPVLVAGLRRIERTLDDREPVALLKALDVRVDGLELKLDQVVDQVDNHHPAEDGPSLIIVAPKS